MKEYKTTRTEVENLVNNKILPSLRAKYIHGDKVDEPMQSASTIMFLYSVSRMSALESLLRLAFIDMFGKDYPSVLNDTMDKYFKEDNK